MVVSFIDIFKTRKGHFKSWVGSVINVLVEIDKKYRNIDETKKKKIDVIFNKIQKTILKDYPIRPDDKLSEVMIIKPHWFFRAFESETTIIHKEIKKLIILLRECVKKYLDRTTSDAERDRLDRLVHDIGKYDYEISSIIRS